MTKRKVRRACWVTSAQGEQVYAVSHARAVVRGDSTVDADLSRLEELLDCYGSFTVTNAVVNVDAWEEDSEGVHAVVPVTGITPETLVLARAYADDDSIKSQCGLRDGCLTEAGTVTFYALLPPTDIISFTIVAMFSQSAEKDIEVSAPETPTIAYYKIPIATAETVGGVKVGGNLEITEDGTLSAKGVGACSHVLSGGIYDGSHHAHTEDCFKDFVADPEDVMDALHRALGIDTDPEDVPENQGAEPDVSQD